MPSTDEHLIQATHNQRLLLALTPGGGSSAPSLRARIEALLGIDRPSYLDWTVTVVFYVAVHLVEAYFDRTHHLHSARHSDRNRSLTSMAELKPIYGDYSDLYNLSIDSRYRCMPAKWTPAEVQRALGLLNRIEQHLSSLP